MSFTISRRLLRPSEIDILVHELHDYPDIGWISADGWKKFGKVFVATSEGRFVGVCVAISLPHWVKLGPFVIAGKFQERGYGRQLLRHIVNALSKYNLYIGSSNPAVGHLAMKCGFQRKNNFFSLPMEIKKYLIMYVFQRLNLTFVLDAVQKTFAEKRGKYFYYIKPII